MSFYRVIAHSQQMKTYDEDIYIAAKQVSQYVIGTQYLDVGSIYSYLNYAQEETSLGLDNQRLVKKPGFEIILTNIDNLYFEISNDLIYMNVKRSEKEYRFLINYAKDKNIEEDNHEEPQPPQ